MASPQFSSFGRSIFARLSVPCYYTQAVAPRRAFASSSRLSDTRTVKSGDKPSEEARKRSIAILNLPKQASKTEVESLIKDGGFQIKKSQFRFDRFTFYNDSYYYAELASEEQAKGAVQKLERSTTFSEERPTYVRILSPEFAWNSEPNHLNRWINDDGSAAAHAILPLKEGRRVQIRIKTPAWKPNFESKPKHLMRARMNYGRELIAKAFEKFGIEAIGVPAANDGRMLPEPKFFCHIDFKTKEGAEEAIRTMHETELENRLMWVAKSELNEVRSRQIGRVNMGVLKELQELGLAGEVDWKKK